uniref:Uncharacterized protein n=1 Tax=Aegilops tauschii subsp. strangulata TaxID=200361 RepID=A0A453MPI4_AEGTS
IFSKNKLHAELQSKFGNSRISVIHAIFMLMTAPWKSI